MKISTKGRYGLTIMIELAKHYGEGPIPLRQIAAEKEWTELLPLDELEKTTGYIRGGTSPIGMRKQYPTYLAKEAELLETIIVSAGRRGLQVELTPTDLKELTHAEYVAVTMKSHTF